MLLYIIDYVLYDLDHFYSQEYSMKTKRSYLVFSQSFLKPLQTSRGILNKKKSLILREEDDVGKISFGEVSPLPGFWEFDFGAALDQAKQWCLHRIESKGFPCLGPALGCLHSNIWGPSIPKTNLPPITNLWTSENRMDCGVIKRKIGLQSHKEEIAVICSWLDQLPEDVKVRLDPNESFSREDLRNWIDALHDRSCVQFIEQPTGWKDDDWLIEFSKDSPIPIALDEAIYRLGSVNSIYELPKNLFLVIKPMLFKDWKIMEDFLQKRREK